MSLAALVVLLALLLVVASSVDANHYRGAIAHAVGARTGREIRIEGPLHAHLLSLHPSFVAAHVVIGNPPWTQPGELAEVGTLSLVFDLHVFPPSAVISRLQLEKAQLHLLRDASGHANWQWQDPQQRGGKGPPLLHSLLVSQTHVELDDARRHLKFSGEVSARDVVAEDANAGVGSHARASAVYEADRRAGTSDSDKKLLRIDGSGQLNDRPVTLALIGDPLATVSPGHAYRFTYTERSSGSRLDGRGTVTRPFDFRDLETRFDAVGEDMKDLYFLVGVSLPNTGPYRLSGRLTRRGRNFRFDELLAKSGQSDLSGTLSIATSSGRSKIDAELSSRKLRTADLGLRAAGRLSQAEADRKLLFPDTPLRFTGTRRSDAKIEFHIRELEVGRVHLHAAAGKVTIEQGVLTVAPLSALLAQGKIAGRLTVDATKDTPLADVDLRVSDLQIGQFAHDNPQSPPLDGLVQARLTLKGRGTSIHGFAASAEGKVTAVLPHGTIRTSLAELAGVDLVRGLGLMFSKSNDTAVRCGIAGFQVHQGTMTTESLVFDTEPVLVRGEGQIHLDSETLDLTLHGGPKKWQLLRLRSPVSVHGTLEHPAIGVGARTALVQGGEAVALGVVLTPVAAILAFVDPGLAKDADCGALLAEARKAGVHVDAAP